jgi:uncharacterized protein (DUF433 family)
MSATTYSPREAAAVSGAPLAAIQKTITTRKIPARVTGTPKRRRLDETALLAFALVAALPAALCVSLGVAYQLLRRMPSGSNAGELVIGEAVKIDAGKALAAARRRLALYDRAREIIVSNPATMGGMPTIGGTRITAQSILGRFESGDSVESVIEDYPYLHRDAVEAAALYANADSPRGRPGGELWRGTS